MANFLRPNIDNKGRLARAIFGLLLLIVGILIVSNYFWFGLAAFIFSGLAFFEAVRGWCLMRACGVKTKY